MQYCLYPFTKLWSSLQHQRYYCRQLPLIYLFMQTIFFWTIIARNISRVLDVKGKSVALLQTNLTGLDAHEEVQFSHEQETQIEAAFHLFDVDGSGTLEEQEMRSALFALGYLTTRNSNISSFDWNRRSVTLEEFKQILRGSIMKNGGLDEIKLTFCAIVNPSWIDDDQIQQWNVGEEILSGKIDLDKLRLACQRFEVKLTENELQHIIYETDSDDSEDVDWGEFVQILKNSCWF